MINDLSCYCKRGNCKKCLTSHAIVKRKLQKMFVVGAFKGTKKIVYKMLQLCQFKFNLLPSKAPARAIIMFTCSFEFNLIDKSLRAARLIWLKFKGDPQAGKIHSQMYSFTEIKKIELRKQLQLKERYTSL